MPKNIVRWTKHEEVILMHSRRNGKTWQEISELVGDKPQNSMEIKIYQLTNGYLDGWSKVQEDKINRYLEEGRTFKEIADLFGETYTSHQIRIKAEALGWNVDGIEMNSVNFHRSSNTIVNFESVKKEVIKDTCNMLGHYPQDDNIEDIVVFMTFAANHSSRDLENISRTTGFAFNFVETVFDVLDKKGIWEKTRTTSIDAEMDADSFIIMADICEDHIHLIR